MVHIQWLIPIQVFIGAIRLRREKVKSGVGMRSMSEIAPPLCDGELRTVAGAGRGEAAQWPSALATTDNRRLNDANR